MAWLVVAVVTGSIIVVRLISKMKFFFKLSS